MKGALRSGHRWVMAAILLCALGLRLATALRHPAPEGDGIAANILLADNLNRGLGFTTYLKWTLYDPSMEHLRPEANRQPVLPVLLSAVFRITGPGMRPAQALSLALGLLFLLSVHSWASSSLGRRTAMITTAFLALSPPFIWFSTQPDCLMLYSVLVFTAMRVAGNGDADWKRAALLGVISGAAYLTRTQGLVLAFSMGVWVLAKGGRARFRKACLFSAVFVLCALPWFARNMRAFGSPMHSQNSQFVLNENHWSAWSVRSTPPGPTDMLTNQGPLACVSFIVRGAARVIEPFGPGASHRGEPFAQPTLAVFLLFAVLGLGDVETRKRMLLPAIVALPLMAALTVHQHSGRYLAPVYAIVTAMGVAGAVRHEDRIRGLLTGFILVNALILVRPLGEILVHENAQREAEAVEGARWIRDNVPEGTWVVTYPNVELYHWVYRRPTVTWPNDYEMLLWPYLEGHGVRYLVVDTDLPELRPWLSGRWRRSPDGGSWEVLDPPPFLTQVWESSSGNTIIYEFTGSVPTGFMAVDSLPPDNCRALGP